MVAKLKTEYLEAAEMRARQFAGAYTGTSGTLAADVIRLLEATNQTKAQRMKTIKGDGVEYTTGAVRSSDAEQTRYDLISPIGLEAVARAAAEGAEKYSNFNWEKGMPIDDLLNHALRHVFCFLAGDRTEDHLGHAAWGLLGAIHSEKLWPELNEGRLRQPGCKAPEEKQPGGACCSQL